MDKQTAVRLKQRLDAAVMDITEQIKNDIYENVIVSTVRAWFGGNDSISSLNASIKANVEARWPFMQKKVEMRLLEFSDYAKQSLAGMNSVQAADLDTGKIAESVSAAISLAIGAIGTSFIAIISGGAGTALIAGGPIGIVIGAVLGAFAFFLGKEAIEGMVSGFIADKKIPALIKKPSQEKVIAELKLNEMKFEQELNNRLTEYLRPVYEVFDAEIRK